MLLLKVATKIGSEVVDLTWTEEGLAVCYKNTCVRTLSFVDLPFSDDML